jgi:O-methyltransferase
MIGLVRLANVRECIESALRDGVQGDLVETGVWRGGTVIYMCAVLKTQCDRERQVWAVDSFGGLPEPDPAFPADAGDVHHTYTQLAVSRAEVEDNFRRYGLLDDRVRFLEGWFKDTLPTAPIGAIAVLRLDGDMYQSTWEALTHLYPKVSQGGWVIVDDYGAVDACRRAVDDYRDRHGITAILRRVDWTGVYWRVDDSSLAAEGQQY